MGAAFMSNLPALQIILPLMAAPICAMVGRPKFAWGLATLVAWASFAISILLFLSVRDGTVISYDMGGWAPPLGIEYRVDVLNAFVLMIVSGMTSFVMPYALKSVASELHESQHAYFYTAFLLCMTGLMGVAITGDAFNVFVFLEISSLSTYALVAMGAARDKRALTAAFNYLIMGTIGATFFVIGLGMMYMVTGTLNMADLAQKIAANGDSRTLRMGFSFVLVGIGLKLAMFPLHLWLPNAYSYAPSAVTTFLASTATKVAIYVMARFMFSIFGFDYDFQANTMQFIMLPLALVAMFAASTVAIFQEDLKRMLAYSSVAQVGYMLLGMSFLTQLGLTATVVHMFNHALIKGGLFMAAGCFIYAVNSSRIDDLKGLGRIMPWTSAAFVLGGLGLIGVPMTAGFISKWYLMQAAFELDWWPIALLIVASSLLAVIYVWRMVEVLYLRDLPEKNDVRAVPLTMLVPMWGLLLLSVYFGVSADITVSAASRAANALIGASNIFWQSGG
ncbi:MAG: monovalent cation/H+ antiporter subunit D family protein [Rhizobiales bacterium]|nr:monovalent cation/H+ antiporter subunit D family protein [Hyphomicrobiales bacterium]